jgi:uncharacterized C2H2 Zn-finger protein
MLYNCPRCCFQTEIYQKYFIHITKKNKCINVNQVDENLDLFEAGRIPSKKKVIRKEEKIFICSECNLEFKTKPSAYKHYKENHHHQSNENKILNKRKFENDITNDFIKNLKKPTNNIQQNNYFNITIQNGSNLNCFGNESFDHIDRLLLLNAIFNYESGMYDEANKPQHTINVFTKIHLELLKCPNNLNCYIQGYYSNSVTYLNQLYELENDSTVNAIYARVKTIYERTIDIYNDIYKNFPQLFLEIYDKYDGYINFDFERNDYESMLNYLKTTLSHLFELYKNSNFSKPDEEKKLTNTFKSHLFDVRYPTKISFNQIVFDCAKLLQFPNDLHH